MADVDKIMETCPLKHDIRVNFWRRFIQKLKKTPISYLTLYSPPIMDVKFFHYCGLIEEKDDVYSNVVGVGLDVNAVSETNTNLNKRLELLIEGDINTLINGERKGDLKAKQFDEKFPFDVINLDYIDVLHRAGLNASISPHIRAIENIFRKQNEGNKDKFILFLTTFVRLENYNDGFIDELKAILENNISYTPKFKEKLNEIAQCDNVEDYFANHEKNCFAVSVTKLILKFMQDFNFTLETGEIKWLTRDSKEPERNLLHLAFYIKKFTVPKASNISKVGKRTNDVETKSVQFLTPAYEELRESVDYERLYEIHSKQINDLNKTTFELPVPEPEENE